MKIDVQRMHPDVRLPAKSTPFAAGFDIYAHLLSESGKELTTLIPRNMTRPVPTGLIVRSSVALWICSRSGLASRSVFVANAPGIVDPDYRGEIKILLYNGSIDNVYIQHGMRIAQLLVPSCESVEFQVVNRIDPDTERGANGFGSTGT